MRPSLSIVRRAVGYWRPSRVTHRRGLRDRMRVSKHVLDCTGATVQRGPFVGMKLGDPVPDSSAKALGSYEHEIHGLVEQALASNPDIVVNIGCSDGYYAIGCKLRLPQARVWAFDGSEWMQDLARRAARLNGADVQVGGFVEPDGLEQLIADARSLVISDCEGGEYVLLDPVHVPALDQATLIVELHELGGRPEELLARFEATHRLTLVASEPRDRNTYPELAGLDDDDRSLAVFERPVVMQWALLEPGRGTSP